MQGPEEDEREAVIAYCEEEANKQWEADGEEGPHLSREEIEEYI